MASSSEYRPDTPHSLALEERHRLCVSGVSEVLSFDEEQVVMDTSLGLLTVDGIHRKGHAFSHVLLPPAPARQSPDGRSPPPPGG